MASIRESKKMNKVMNWAPPAVGLTTVVTVYMFSISVDAAVLDDYSDPPFFGYDDITTPGPSAVINQAASVLGGNRDIFLEALSGGVTAVSILDDATVMDFTTGPAATGALTARYDGFPSSDLTEGGTLEFFELLLPFVQGSADVTMDVDGVTSAAKAVSGAGTPVNLTFAFSEFGDLTSVDSVSVTITGTQAATDINIDRLSTAVPEPSSLVLVTIGACVVLSRSRRS